MSFALAVRGEKLYTASSGVPGNDDGIVSLTRKSKTPDTPVLKHNKSAVVLTASSKKRDIWDNVINKLPGSWESNHAETLAVTMPPHFIRSRDAIYAHYGSEILRELIGSIGVPGDLDIFTLCTHSNIKDFFKVWKNPLSTRACFLFEIF